MNFLARPFGITKQLLHKILIAKFETLSEAEQAQLIADYFRGLRTGTDLASDGSLNLEERIDSK